MCMYSNREIHEEVVVVLTVCAFSDDFLDIKLSNGSTSAIWRRRRQRSRRFWGSGEWLIRRGGCPTPTASPLDSNRRRRRRPHRHLERAKRREKERERKEGEMSSMLVVERRIMQTYGEELSIDQWSISLSLSLLCCLSSVCFEKSKHFLVIGRERKKEKKGELREKWRRRRKVFESKELMKRVRTRKVSISPDGKDEEFFSARKGWWWKEERKRKEKDD